MEAQWPLIFFTLFICLGAGTFGVVGVLGAFGKDKGIRVPALIVSFAAVVIGGISSALHLEHWERFFNGFGNITSGITQELIGIILMVAAIAVYYLLERRGDTPKWMGWVALAVSVLMIILMAHSYAMAARPLWDSILLYGYYLAQALLLGSLTALLLYGAKSGDSALASNIALGGGIVQTVVTLGFAVLIPTLESRFSSVGYYFDSTEPTKAMQDPGASFSGFMMGEHALLFWGGAVLLGAIIPLIAAFLARKRTGTGLVGAAAIGVISALIGGIAFRALLYLLGFTPFVFY